MRSVFRPGALGDVSSGNTVFYGASITDADIVMADGKGLERAGVTPGELALTQPADLAAKREIRYSLGRRPAALVGVEITAEKAAAVFPLEKPKKAKN